MHLRKGDAAEEVERGGVIRLRLAGKASDEICCERAAGKVPASAQPGKYLRSRSVTAVKAAVSYFRFMRERVRSVPLWRERWK